MKTKGRVDAKLIVATLVCACGIALEVSADGPPPLPDLADLVGTWLFDDTYLVDASGSPPLSASNLVLVSSWQSNAVQIDAAAPAVLRYPEIQTNGRPNLLCDRGSVMFWFRPDNSWTGVYTPFVEVGTWTEDASIGWWSFYWQDDALWFAAQTNGSEALYLSTPAQFASNEWYQIVLNYTATNSELYINDQFITNGTGVTYWPSATVRSNGFCFFNDSTRRTLDVALTFDGPIEEWEITSFYDGLSEMLEVWEEQQEMMQGQSLELSLSGGVMMMGEGGYTNLIVSAEMLQQTNLLLTICSDDEAAQYDLYYATNLASPITWVWLARSQPGETQLVLEGPLDSMGFFRLGTMLDSDWDGLPDAYELLISMTSTNTPSLVDSDGDGMPDNWELRWGLDPQIDDADANPDGDWDDNYEEYLNGNDPWKASVEIGIAQPHSASVIP